LKLLDKDNPNRLTTRLCAEDVRKLKNANLEIGRGILFANLFLIKTALDIRMLFGELHIGALFSKPSEVRAANNCALHACLFGKRQISF
jgi:hypothetical protein